MKPEQVTVSFDHCAPVEAGEPGAVQSRWLPTEFHAPRWYVAVPSGIWEQEHSGVGEFNRCVSRHLTQEEAEAAADAYRRVHCPGVGDLFVVAQSEGLCYCDSSLLSREGDYQLVAFLPYSTLVLRWRIARDVVHRGLRWAIERDAARMAARRGESFPIDACGHTVLLGG
jgi:hypothetical protein